jgi:hypothetical protein
MNLSSIKIPTKRKEKLKISGSIPACTHTTCKYSIP